MAYERDVTVTDTIKGAWQLYREKKKLEDKEFLSFKEYKEICYNFNKLLSKKIVEESFEYKMPSKLGILRIRKGKLKFKIKDGKLKPSRKIIDWGNTRKIWYKKYPGLTLKELKNIKNKPLVMYTNEHTNGEVMRWYWDKNRCEIKNKSTYLFRPTKYNRLYLKQWINNEDRENDYAF